MSILIPSTASAVIFSWFSQSLRLWIPNKKVRWVRHRSWTWTEPYSFEQATWQTWCNSETSAVKTGATNVRDNAILPPTVSGDGAGARFVSTEWHTEGLPSVIAGRRAAFASLFRSMSRKDFTNFLKSSFFPLFFEWGDLSQKVLRSHGGVGWELRRLY